VSGETSCVATLVAPRTIELREEPIPQAGDGGIVVRVRAALTDGTDLKAYRRGHPKMPMPTRFGHEFSGDVAAVGSGVRSFSVGEAVMCAHTAPCGICFWCSIEQEELCERLMPEMLLGAYSDYIAVPARVVQRNCFSKPAHVTYPQGAFLEPLSCVVHSVSLLAARPGSQVAVLGNGAFGILHALLLAREGMRPLVIGRRASRAAFARSLGLDAIEADATQARDAIDERTDGRGADAVVECTGNGEVWERAADLTRRGGTISFFGGLPSGARVSFAAARLHYDEVRLISPFHFTPRDVRRAFELIAAQAFPLEHLISDRYRLADVSAAFAHLDAGAGMKVLIEP
jgi:L-iditol 2-dehydrogenase